MPPGKDLWPGPCEGPESGGHEVARPPLDYYDSKAHERMISGGRDEDVVMKDPEEEIFQSPDEPPKHMDFNDTASPHLKDEDQGPTLRDPGDPVEKNNMDRDDDEGGTTPLRALDDEGFSQAWNTTKELPEGTPSRLNHSLLMNLPREVRDHVRTLTGLDFLFSLKVVLTFDRYRYMRKS